MVFLPGLFAKNTHLQDKLFGEDADPFNQDIHPESMRVLLAAFFAHNHQYPPKTLLNPMNGLNIHAALDPFVAPFLWPTIAAQFGKEDEIVDDTHLGVLSNVRTLEIISSFLSRNHITFPSHSRQSSH
jgi:hypothetical protein